MSETVKVLVKCPARVDYKGFFAAHQHWPEGMTEREVSLADVEKLKIADIITLVAVGDDQVEAFKKMSAPSPKAEKVETKKSAKLESVEPSEVILPTRDEYKEAGYDVKGYDDYVKKERTNAEAAGQKVVIGKKK